MNYPIFFDPTNSSNLFGLNENLKFFSSLYKNKKLPKVLMLTGNKGTGKSTLVNHFLFSTFDENNYDNEKLTYNSKSNFLNQFKNNLFPNVIYFKGSDFKNTKVEDIRDLKTKIFQSIISNHERFIVFDDIELFNINSLNALLKIIEEPTNNNYFFLINNKAKPLPETIKSRSIEYKIILNENQRISIIDNLVKMFKLELVLDPLSVKISPGNFVKFNYICKEYNIYPSEDFVENLSKLLSLYKKDKDILYINLIFFLADYYLSDLKQKKFLKNNQIYEIKNFIFNNLNSFLMYNINQSALINAVNNRLKNE